MARKMQFDAAISKDMKSASQDGFADNIKMIDIEKIKPSTENFYELSGLELLADDIEREGLKHNLVVSKDKDGEGYWLKSGHRRLAAIKLLIESGRIHGTKLPCYIDGEKTRAESKLDLIMLNATQRRYTDAETMREYDELKKTFKELEDEGKPLKGRIRDNIAAVLQVSPAQVGKIENIKHNAVPEVEKAIENGKISISTANEIAKLAPETQAKIIETKPDISHKEIKEMQQPKTYAPKSSVSPAVVEDELDEDELDEYEPESDEDFYDDDEPKKPVVKMTSPSASQSFEHSKTLELTLSVAEATNLLDFIEINIFDDEDAKKIKGITDKLKDFLKSV